MFRLAHLSDVHLAPLPRPGLGDVSLKRALGYLNWHRRRKREHLRPVLDALVADLTQQSPDHIAVTGDLVNIGLPAEFVAAKRWLEGLGKPSSVTVVPGNHDAYVRLKNDPGFHRWSAYMRPIGDTAARSQWGPGKDGFPFVRIFGNIALIGLSSAIPTPPFVAAGRLGEGQRAALEHILCDLRQAGLCRVILIHHPPLVAQTSPRRALRDAVALGDILKRQGAELILHGHNHNQSLHWAAGPEQLIPVVGVPSASIGWSQHRPLARYNLFLIGGTGEQPGRPRIELIGRGLRAGDAAVHEIERIAL